jgi:hypothetical protein
MRPSMMLRIASAISFLLFAGHSAGGLSSWSPQSDTTVLNTMRSVHFPVQGFTRTYFDFYMGFGLIISVYLLAQTVLLWQLASWIKLDLVRVRSFASVLLFVAVASAMLDWFFFFAAPLLMTIGIAASIGIALVQTRTPRPVGDPEMAQVRARS